MVPLECAETGMRSGIPTEELFRKVENFLVRLISKGMHVWVRDDSQGWVAGTILSKDLQGHKVEIEGTGEVLWRNPHQYILTFLVTQYRREYRIINTPTKL
jgi:hypothetical protein